MVINGENMQTPTGWKRKFILLFKSEKRLGAKQIASHFAQKDFTSMKNHILTATSEFSPQLDGVSITNSELLNNTPTPNHHNYEPKRIKDLTKHLNRLQQEFIGKSELCFYHTSLIVLLRRGYKTEENFVKFEQLWQQEQAYLLENLPLRWLVSAADTFVDFSSNPTRQALLMNVATLINTLKVYETQLDLLGNPQTILTDRVEALQQQHLALYDGLHYFRLGTDDTLHNMQARYKKFAQVDKFASDFLLVVFERLQTDNTAFGTMRKFHKFDWC